MPQNASETEPYAYIRDIIATDPGYGHWLAGFVDGEGCFLIGKKTTTSGYCRFRLKLRDDDYILLEQASLRTCLGYVHRSPAPPVGNGKSQATWTVTDKYGCLGLVMFFDHFPLRSKKAKDYGVWREAVFAWNNGFSPVSYKETLSKAREYDPNYSPFAA